MLTTHRSGVSDPPPLPPRTNPPSTRAPKSPANDICEVLKLYIPTRLGIATKYLVFLLLHVRQIVELKGILSTLIINRIKF